MTINKDIFGRGKQFNYDFQEVGLSTDAWAGNDRIPEQLVPTHCSFCGVQCGMFLKVADGVVIGVEARDYPHNRGSLCPKGIVAYQQQNHPDRIRYPMMRKNGRNSPLERVSWDEALTHITQRWTELQQQHGKDSVAICSGSSMTNEKCYLAGKFARIGLGTRHVDYNGRLCMSSAAVAYDRAFGLDRAPVPMPDIALTDCIIAAGTNVAECFPIVMQWVWRARDHGAKLIVVDPRETPIARTADLWLPIKPGTDIALYNALLRQVIADGNLDESYIADRTNGFEAVREMVEPFTPEYAESLCGVPAENIVAAARIYGAAPRSLIMHARGIEHSTHGVDNCLALINLALARGQVGKPGGGTMTLTGQGNGQGGREVGQKASQLPGYRHIDVLEDREYVAGVWGVPESEIPPAGAAGTEMVNLMLNGDIKSAMVLCWNMMVSLPDNKVVQEALQKLDFLVVCDFFPSETAELADVVLPSAVWCEDEGTTTNLEGRVVKINKAVEPLGEARPDWEIMCDIARRMGRGKYFPFTSAGQIFDELRVASRGGKSDYYGISYEKIDRQDGVFWPCPTEDSPGTPRLHIERFAFPDGRARMFAIPYQPPVEEPSADFPLRLTTGRVVYHYLSGNQTRRLGFLNSQAPDPWVEVHPQTAGPLGISDGDIVRVVTPRNQMELRAFVVPTIRPDTLFIPFHYGHEGAANQLTNPAVEPTVKIPEYKACAARIERRDAPAQHGQDSATIRITPEDRPAMFPYILGEVTDQKSHH